MALTTEVPETRRVAQLEQNQEEPHVDLTTPPVSDKEDEPRTSSPERFELETFTPFSSSHLWKLMSSFYDRQGVESWAQGIVPHFITSNTFIAKRYVQVFVAYLRDALTQLDPTEPLYIVELGTGSGKFSFYFLQWLHDMEAVLNLSFPLGQIRYVMTDFTDSNLKFWQTHPALAPFVQRGTLDFAIFDATHDSSLYLIHAKHSIVSESLQNPMCVIANYLFDTLHHELFRVEHSVLKQGLISVGSTRLNETGTASRTIHGATCYRDDVDPLDPDIIKRLSNLYRYDAIDADYYTNPHINAVLKWYCDYYNDSPATFLVPIGALHAIERLKQLSRNEMLILSGDKGHTNPDHFRGLQDPHIAVHGSFSVILKGVLALMKLSFYDADLFYKFRDVFLDQTPGATAKVKVDVMLCLQNTWRHYFQLDKEKDIAFEIGRVYYGMREYEEALRFYTRSLEEMGKHHVTYHNMGLCFYSTRRLPEALDCFQAATKLNSCYQKAATWLQRVQNELSPEQVVAGNEKEEHPPLVSMQQIDVEVPNPEHTKYSNANSTKKALFIGINYFGTDAELRGGCDIASNQRLTKGVGCIKDVENLHRFVKDRCGFPANNMRRLTDDQQGHDRPTRANILAGMRWLVENAPKADFKAGMDAFNAAPTEKTGPVAEHRVKDRTTAADVILLSGCKDTQTSADAVIEGTATGAMSYAFIAAMNKYSLNLSYQDLLKTLREFMMSEYTQVPCLSAGRPVTMKVQFSL
ncbi:hypothetical protein DYB32_000863 [Aphanomyces invadans]|uniref:Peptidase C14 caspase domain-containing protein n=1 Tax=Aphanomyces invadans TaxID=157072 RepID=A0A418B8N1_9STRA|nr:hypothetical protein DYB32_000863 [Aphanomyces invadans]